MSQLPEKKLSPTNKFCRRSTFPTLATENGPRHKNVYLLQSSFFPLCHENKSPSVRSWKNAKYFTAKSVSLSIAYNAVSILFNLWENFGCLFRLLFFFCFWLLHVSLRVQGSAYRSVFTKSLLSLAVSLVAGRLTNSPTLHLYAGPIYRVIWPARKENNLQSCRSGNRTWATQLELTLFRAPYPLDHRSFPVTVKVDCIQCNFYIVQPSSNFGCHLWLWPKYVSFNNCLPGSGCRTTWLNTYSKSYLVASRKR